MSLIEVAQKLLALNPDAVELFKKANGTSRLQVDWVLCPDSTACLASEAVSVAHGPSVSPFCGCGLLFSMPGEGSV